LRRLREVASAYGFANIVYVDESGFESSTCRQRGWAAIGQKVYGDRSGNKRPRTSLIAAKRGRRLLAPVLFPGSTDADWFNQWLEHHLFPVLDQPSVIVADNARFHKTEPTLCSVRELAPPFAVLAFLFPGLQSYRKRLRQYQKTQAIRSTDHASRPHPSFVCFLFGMTIAL
jgi:hypothetical protein